MNLIVVDNYDSFTFNLVQLLERLGASCTVVRNDETTVDDLLALPAAGIVISAGPCRPEDSGICLPLLAQYRSAPPLLGVCLGHQAIAQHFGASLVPSRPILHGTTCRVWHDGRTLFRGLPLEFSAARYNSVTVDPATLPHELDIAARSDAGEVMAVRHKRAQIEGIQFHPESIVSECGPELLHNWLEAL